LILASASPQRRAILQALGVEFVVRPSSVAEIDEGPATVVARENALRKALAARGSEEEWVLGVDTVVCLDLELWGKPPNEEAARETLHRLAGQTHSVVSGFAFVGPDGVMAGDDTTLVEFRSLSDEEIDWYVGCGEWEGRAGGYAIQGRGGALVRRVEGDYLNVVGLPVSALLDAGVLQLGSALGGG
jgi:septum formation protein